MARSVEVVAATVAHAEAMLPHMRQADIDECWAAARHTPEQALLDGLRYSTACWAGIVDGEVVCMFGVAPLSLLGAVGIPWMLGTDAIERHQFAFLRRSRAYLPTMMALYGTLANYVDERNVVAQRWLRWMGFALREPEPFGPDRMLFRRFEMRRAPCAIQQAEY